jgi:integrase
VKLTDAKVKNAKPADRPHRISDGGGMFLEVTPSGAKYWRLAYRFNGKQKLLALGVYPDVSLAAARAKRDTARRQLADGRDPGAVRKAEKRAGKIAAANTFEAVAREWLAEQRKVWADSTWPHVERQFDQDIFPAIGRRPIAEIAPAEVLDMARAIQRRGVAETARRALQKCGQVFRHAVAVGIATSDPTRDLRGVVKVPKPKHFAAITDPKEAGNLLRMIEGHTGTAVVLAALRLSPVLMVRPGELRRARWADVNLDSAEWRFRVTKTDQEHVVPLPTQAVAILRDLHRLTGRGEYVFPSARGKGRPMSENAVTAALRSIGVPAERMSAHGFRAMARTLQDEVLGFRADLIEHQLAHTVRDPLGRAYNRTQFLDARRKNMQSWADYLDRLRTGADVVELGASRRKAEEGAEISA